MACQTQNLNVSQVMGLRQVGKTIDGFDVIGLRVLVRRGGAALSATVAVAKKRQHFEVHASETQAFVNTKVCFQVEVFEVATCAGFVRFGTPEVQGHFGVLKHPQRAAFAHADGFPSPVLTKALGRSDVELTTERFGRDPERVMIQRSSRPVVVSARPEMGWSGDLVVHTAANCR